MPCTSSVSVYCVTSCSARCYNDGDAARGRSWTSQKTTMCDWKCACMRGMHSSRCVAGISQPAWRRKKNICFVFGFWETSWVLNSGFKTLKIHYFCPLKKANCRTFQPGRAALPNALVCVYMHVQNMRLDDSILWFYQCIPLKAGSFCSSLLLLKLKWEELCLLSFLTGDWAPGCFPFSSCVVGGTLLLPFLLELCWNKSRKKNISDTNTACIAQIVKEGASTSLGIW